MLYCTVRDAVSKGKASVFSINIIFPADVRAKNIINTVTITQTYREQLGKAQKLTHREPHRKICM